VISINGISNFIQLLTKSLFQQKKERTGKRSLTKFKIEKYRQLNLMYVFSLCASLNQIFILLICRLIQFPKRKEPSKKVFVVDRQVRGKEKQVR